MATKFPPTNSKPTKKRPMVDTTSANASIPATSVAPTSSSSSSSAPSVDLSGLVKGEVENTEKSKRKRQRRNNISWNDIKVVQNLIERCVQHHMTQAEIVTALKVQANVDPAFTCLVWQKLLDQNPNFFYGYALRLRLKDQIIAFNYLIDQHSKMLSQHNQVGGTASVAQANQLIGGLQQQQLNDLKQLQHYYAMQHAAEQQTMMFQQFQQNGSANGAVPKVVAAAIVPGLTDNLPLSLDPQSLGSGGIAENSLLTPMIHAAAQAGQTNFFPPSPLPQKQTLKQNL